MAFSESTFCKVCSLARILLMMFVLISCLFFLYTRCLYFVLSVHSYFPIKTLYIVRSLTLSCLNIERIEEKNILLPQIATYTTARGNKTINLFFVFGNSKIQGRAIWPFQEPEE